MLAPHHAEHRELEVVRVTAAQPVADGVELVVGHAETAVQRLDRTLGHRHRDPTATAVSFAARAALSTSERTIPKPSAEPRSASDARSGCGMRPATLPAAFITPAMARSEPFGFEAAST
jgi:hypothetical protein